MRQKLPKQLTSLNTEKGKKEPKAPNNAGFVLLELLCSLGIITLTLSLVIALIPRFTDGLVALQAHLIATEAKAVQQRALASGREATYALARIPLLPGVQYAFPRGASGPPGRPAAPLTTAITFAHQKLKSSPTGVLAAGTLYVGSPARGVYRALTSSPGTLGGLAHYRWDGIRFQPIYPTERHP